MISRRSILIGGPRGLLNRIPALSLLRMNQAGMRGGQSETRKPSESGSGTLDCLRVHVSDMTDGDDDSDTPTGTAVATETTDGGLQARYEETTDERLLVFENDRRIATIAQNRAGYAMLKVRAGPDGDERERYYGFDMALDHAAELLGVAPHDLPVPDPAADMGM
jgi:hypothetical protein